MERALVSNMVFIFDYVCYSIFKPYFFIWEIFERYSLIKGINQKWPNSFHLDLGIQDNMYICKHEATFSFKNGCIKLHYINKRLSQAEIFSDSEAVFLRYVSLRHFQTQENVLSLWEARAVSPAPNSAQAAWWKAHIQILTNIPRLGAWAVPVCPCCSHLLFP